MTIERRIIKKWTKITLFCGAHSFFWGAMGGGNILAMIAGMATLILMFSAIEGHPTYQAKRSGNALFAKAMDVGVKIRLYFAAYILFSGALIAMGATRLNNTVAMILAFPYMGEMWIGMGASLVCRWLTGTSFDTPRGRADYPQQLIGMLDNLIATYTTTIITGLLHTLILAALCSVVYLLLKRRAT